MRHEIARTNPTLNIEADLHTDLHANPALIVALALAAGITAQVMARHLRIPGIVLLLGVGVLLGPDGLGFVQPEVLGESLNILVGFAVAVILFEGGLNLRWSRIRRQAGVIRWLLTVGVVITALGGALAARLFLGWDWTFSLLFGTLVIVTGPTVITPLLRRIRVRRPLETILETEGVFVDGIGAITAIVCLEVVLRPEGSSLAGGFLGLPSRLVFGLVFGLVGGLLLALALRWRRTIGEGLENAFTLALVLVLFQVSNALMAETGIISAIVAGLVVGNVRSPVQRELKEFKEQLTVLLIGMLFILLAADVRLAEIQALGWPGLLTVLALMLVVRPLSVLVCTWRVNMPWRERAFLAWIAPRGIVAAAVATLFDERLTEAGISGGQEMRALLFLVIAATVLFQGATAEYIARWLGVRRPSNQGFAILGANPLARTLGRLLLRQGEPVVLMDSSVTKHRKAQEEDFRVVYGNALEEWGHADGRHRIAAGGAGDPAQRRRQLAVRPQGARRVQSAAGRRGPALGELRRGCGDGGSGRRDGIVRWAGGPGTLECAYPTGAYRRGAVAVSGQGAECGRAWQRGTRADCSVRQRHGDGQSAPVAARGAEQSRAAGP
ncbi:MAG: sodium:proton antiporter [bacterium]